MPALGPESAFVFRITHVNNVPWILDHGLHCQSSPTQDPVFVSIGMSDLIQKRTTRQVPVGMGGVLSDYVPFYFTPWSIMMYKIMTGHDGVVGRRRSDIAFFVTSLVKLRELAIPYVFTDGHAFLRETEYFTELGDLGRIDWDLLRSRDFRRDPEDPGKVSRYQAEALAHQSVPTNALLGIVAHDEPVRRQIETEVQSRGLSVTVKSLPEWYF